MATEANKNKLYSVRDVQALIGKTTEADKATLQGAFDKIINGIKAKHL